MKRRAGEALKAQGMTFDLGFTSLLQRAQKTCALLLEHQGQTDLPVTRHEN